MTDEFPVPKLIYDRKILVNGSMVYVDEKGIVVGVAVSGAFPEGIVIGQQLPLQPPTAEERLSRLLTMLITKKILDQVDVTAISKKE